MKDQKFCDNWIQRVICYSTTKLQRTLIESCEVQRRKAKDLRDKEKHESLQPNIIEHILQRHQQLN